MQESHKRVLELKALYGETRDVDELDHASRGMALTGSDIPSICGENIFETPNAVFFKKIFAMHHADTPAMAHGRFYEPVAVDRFEQKTGGKTYRVKFMRHPQYPWIGGTFDRLAVMPTGEGVLIEVKCPVKRSIGNYVPEHYRGQVQTYLEIAGLEKCLFVQYKPSYVTPVRQWQRPEKLTVTPMYRDRAWFENRLFILWEFWKRICAFRAGVLPRANAAAACIQQTWRWRRNTCTRAIRNIAIRAHAHMRNELFGVYESVIDEMERTERPVFAQNTESELVVCPT